MASTFYPRSNTSTNTDAFISQWWRDHVQALIDAGRHEDAKWLYLDVCEYQPKRLDSGQ